MTTDAVPSTNIQDLLFNAQLLDYLLSGNADTYVTRLGIPRKSYQKLQSDINAIGSTAYADFLAQLTTQQATFLAQLASEDAQFLAYLDTLNPRADEIIAGFQSVLKFGDSARFHPENGENLTGSTNGLMYLPNTNNLFKTSASYDTPIAATAGTLTACVSVPEHVYRCINRNYSTVVGVMQGATTSGDLRIAYRPAGSVTNSASVAGRFEVVLWDLGMIPQRASAVSAVLPVGVVRVMVAARVSGGNLQVDLIDLDNPAAIIPGTPTALPAGWAGVKRLYNNLCIGGTGETAFPTGGPTYQHVNAWRGEIGCVGLTDTTLTDANLLAIASGSDLPTVAGASNVRLYCPIAESGGLSTRVQSRMAAVVDSLALRGTVLPGSHLRRQAATFITLDGQLDKKFAACMNGTAAAEIQLTGKFAGVSGRIQVRVIDSAGQIVRDWHGVENVPASGSTWSAWVTLPAHVHGLHLEVRATSAPTAVSRLNTEILCGYAVNFQAQSQVYYGTMKLASSTGAASSMPIVPKRWGGTVVFVGTNESVQRFGAWLAEQAPTLVGPGFVTIANYLREKTPLPLLLVNLSVAGTALSDLINDAVTGRQWSTDRDLFSLMVFKNRSGQYPYTAQVMNWGSTDIQADYAGQILAPYLRGTASATIAKPAINHYLFDGVDFDPRMRFVCVPFSRNTPLSGATADSDSDSSAVRRQSMRTGAAQLGYLLGPEATVYAIEGTTDAGTHPSSTDAVNGIPLYAKSLAEAAAIGCGLGAWPGTVQIDSSTVKFTDAGRTEIHVGFSGPIGSRLYTYGGGTSVSVFEVSTDSGATWSRSGFTASLYDGMTCSIVTAGAAFPAGTTRVRAYSGSPGGYGAAYFPTWLAGALFSGGFPVSGGNDAYTVT